MTNELWFDLDKAAREEAADRFRQVSLENWDLSARTKNALLRSNPSMSIGDVLCAGPEIAVTRGLGRTTLQELHLKAMALLDPSGTAGLVAPGDTSHVVEGTEEQQLALPNEVLGLSVNVLQLDKRTQTSLQQSEIDTIGDLVEATKAGPKRHKNLTRGQLESARVAISNLCDSVSLEGQPNWRRYYDLQGVSLIPSDLSELASPLEIIRSLSSASRGILLAENDDRMWYIIQRRYGLQGVDQLTLADLGDAFGLSRERVRQIEVKGLDLLRRRFVEQDFTGQGYRVQPAILEHVNQLAVIPLRNGDNNTRESELRREVETRYGDAAGGSWPEISLIFVLSGFDRVEFNAIDLDPVWIRKGTLDVDALRLQVEELDRLLTVEQPLPLDELDILRYLNAKLSKKGTAKVALAQLRRLKRTCSSIEERPDGTLWGRFDHLRGRGNQVERLLFESGKPLTIHEIVRRLNHRLVKSGQRKVDIRNLGNQLTNDDRFVSIGGSGYWGLRAWPNIETASIVDLMEQCLIKLDKPATLEEIHRYVSERRQAEASSIGIYLSTNDRFVRMSPTTWGLTSWPEAKQISAWNRAHVTRFLHRYFGDRRASELPYSEVRKALAEAMGVAERQAQGKLNTNPILATRQDARGGQLIAYLRTDTTQHQSPSDVGSSSARQTKRDHIQAVVRQCLSSAPNHAMPLRELVATVQRELGSKEKTVYAYVGEMDDVQRLVPPGSRVMICQLKTPPKPAVYPQVLQITTPELRAKVERALPYLTEDAVDVGLFLLSKEFEAILKDFMVAAAEIGKLSSTPGPDPSKWKLNNMVDVVAKEGLITDKSILHYLREERNMRAHGSMPSLAERQLMMNNAPYLASLYIDYIRFFDDLCRTL